MSRDCPSKFNKGDGKGFSKGKGKDGGYTKGKGKGNEGKRVNSLRCELSGMERICLVDVWEWGA